MKLKFHLSPSLPLEAREGEEETLLSSPSRAERGERRDEVSLTSRKKEKFLILNIGTETIKTFIKRVFL